MAAEFQPFTLSMPTAGAVALVGDSPHSGTRYPVDYRHAVAHDLLRQGEDTHVGGLWRALPTVGATLLEAHFPRTYIDVNRTLEDLDPELLDGPWPEPLAPGEKTRLGLGLVWRRLRGDMPPRCATASITTTAPTTRHWHRRSRPAMLASARSGI